MPTNPYELPLESTDPTVYYVPETTDAAQLVPTSASTIPLSKAGSAKIQMNAKKLALRLTWSSELNEDSIVPIIANYRRQAVRSMQNAIDNVLLNGDVATGVNVNVNLIDGTPTSGTKFLAFDGLRKYALVTNSAQSVNAAAEMPVTNAAGKVSGTPANNVKGQGIIVLRPNFLIGYRRQVQANVEFFPWADAYHLVVTVRLCLVAFDSASAAEMYNFSV